MKRNGERILLLQLKRIGDFILTAPAVAALRAARPQAEIVAVVPSQVIGIARCFTGLSSAWSYHHGRLNLRTWTGIAAGSWDASLDFSGTDRAALMTRLSRATIRSGYRKFADTPSLAMAYNRLSDASVRDLHTVDFHLALLETLGIRALAGGDSGFALPAKMRDWAARRLSQEGGKGPHVVVHPGTARVEKYWPAERWARVIEELAGREENQVVLTGARDPLEQAHLAELRRHLRAPVVDLTGRLSLLETAAIIAGARLALGVDSMAMHLAAMFQTPQIVLYGPTNPFHWRPRHGRAVVIVAGQPASFCDWSPHLDGQDMSLISTEQVINAIRAFPRAG